MDPTRSRPSTAQAPRVSIRHEDFDLSAEVAALRAGDGGTGAVVTFTGTVRDRDGATAGIRALELEHYPGMTEAAIEAMIDEARRRFDIRAARVVHRVGRLAPLDQIVLVAVTSAHRGQAFGLRVPDGLPQDPGPLLEEGDHPSGRGVGGRAQRRRRGAGALGRGIGERRWLSPTGRPLPLLRPLPRPRACPRGRPGIKPGIQPWSPPRCAAPSAALPLA
jgi:molybdopterin synthase catalytic subunit